MKNRIQRVNQLIKREIAQILLRELDSPKNTLVTVTKVKTSVNLNQATVYVSVIPEAKTQRIFKMLSQLIYEIQGELNRHLKMRPIPRIRFVEEKETKQAGRIEEILEKIKEND
ncbi:30S ribosome-binding factor RbfA [Patescibacteria group bacterium]